ncbi:cryptochrome/photolyase family protein [Aquitalea sp. FJL05]|uniref:cryptochrome/photolyase family protein n=1 Tax=Aquitalea sp. FJL05 TaxID=2153366 RepID=UPI000F5A4719|nr:cryptochrome/photolyase family protein [Aquitalea sp. FJL05]RQO68775.1 cryptochrome/photolyase family protein [Aquitalea sp. FJL05]
MTELRLILGDQLNLRHSWFSRVDDHVVYLLLELRQETDYVRHHAQKLLAVLAAMRDFAARLKAAGHRVRYVTLDHPSNRGTLEANLDALVQHYAASHFSWQLPDEWRLDQQLQAWAARQSLVCQAVDSEHFLATRLAASQLFAGKASWRMETFYRHMRKQYGVLLDERGGPAGGKWNFDQDNRKPWRGTPAPLADARLSHDHSALWQMLQDAGVAALGQPSAAQLRWPLHREEALALLQHFIQHGLPCFGDYQDAMHSAQPRLFHSLLSFALNTKMLSPLEVVHAAAAAWQDGKVPLAAAEGFIRQILGWREYVRGVYWARMPGYAHSNHFDHQQPLPHWFWSGDTGMHCLAQAIGQSLRDAYAHHIQRLMVIGNFSLLAGLSPQALHEWYLGIYIDAFEWVELPNTLGMSQFADGGLLASKPYVSGSAYIQRMSNYCGDCRYRREQRHGDDACPFNALYWDFFQRNAATLGSNPRLALVYRQLQQMDAAESTAIASTAHAIRQRLETL